MGIEALMTALPISGIDSQLLASLSGVVATGPDDFVEPYITFLEPPAGQSVPYIDPVEAITVLLRADGLSKQDAYSRALSEFALLRPELPLLQRPRLYTGFEVMNVSECISVSRFVAFLRERDLLSADLLDFLERACDVTRRLRLFRMHDDWDKPITLAELPTLPSPKAMIEFFVGLQSDIGEAIAPNDPWEPIPPALFAWREAMRPVAERLEKVLGEKVYHFQDLDDKLDDDCCHRFLALHCWCSLLPESDFVKYLLEATGFAEVEALKAALIDPASYTQPFTYNYAFVGIETAHCHFRYLTPGQKRRVGIAFRTEAAKLRAMEIALEQIDADILFLMPRSLTTEEWMNEATIYGHPIGFWHDFNAPVAFLAEVDEIHVVSDKNRPGRGFDLKVGPELEVFMWYAHTYGVKMFADEPAAWILHNPETCLERSGVPERVAAIDDSRRAFTEQLGKLLVQAEYGSSGLWAGGNVSYDSIDLPFPLIKRIAAWQRNFDDTLIPPLPGTADETWWAQHHEEERNIAKAIREALGGRMEVVYTE